jgi:hypothetical protein
MTTNIGQEKAEVERLNEEAEIEADNQAQRDYLAREATRGLIEEKHFRQFNNKIDLWEIGIKHIVEKLGLKLITEHFYTKDEDSVIIETQCHVILAEQINFISNDSLLFQISGISNWKQHHRALEKNVIEDMRDSLKYEAIANALREYSPVFKNVRYKKRPA